MYSETPHGAGALGLSELQEQALCMGEPNGFFLIKSSLTSVNTLLLQGSYITSSLEVSILTPNILQ